MHRLGSMPARVKLKGIDGGPHKRWSMWFNSMVSIPQAGEGVMRVMLEVQEERMQV